VFWYKLEFFLDRAQLSENHLLRRDTLDQYFPSGLIPFESIEGNRWNVYCFVPEDAEYYVDSQLEKALNDWPDSINIVDLGSYKRFIKNGMLSFYDSWSLYYWSLALTWMQLNKVQCEKIALFHIDDHKDFASPHLTQENKEYASLFSGNAISLDSPSSIAEAIREKSIGIGSFIAPLVHSINNLDIFHWRSGHCGQDEQLWLSPTFVEDSLLAPGKFKPGLEFSQDSGPVDYTLSANGVALAKKLHNYDIVFLHFDCDCFANRYNLDSNWSHNEAGIDLPLKEMKKRITELFLVFRDLPAKIFLNVALSPGFFPAEYWQEICQHIFQEAEDVGILKEDSFSAFLKDAHSSEILSPATAFVPSVGHIDPRLQSIFH